jgi:hypothetical protein
MRYTETRIWHNSKKYSFGVRLTIYVNVLFMFLAFKLGITEFMLKYEQFIFFNLLFL